MEAPIVSSEPRPAPATRLRPQLRNVQMPGAHALIVDDSSTARIMLSRMLQRTGIESDGVASAEEAFDFLATQPVDLIFLDHLLPGMDGFEALRQLKHNDQTRQIPVFMYTSQNADQYREQAQALGAAGVIGKQISRQQLNAALEAISSDQPAPARPVSATEVIEDSSPDQPIALAPANLRPLTGRLSTLEIAYEEANEELHQLRQEVARLRAGDYAEFDRHTRRMRLFVVLLLVMMIATGGILWYQLETVRTLLHTVSNQSSVLKDIISQLLTMVGH